MAISFTRPLATAPAVPDRLDQAVVYALAAHRDEGTAAATLVYRATDPPESVRAYLVRLAGTFEAAGCPSMAGHARRIACEIRAEESVGQPSELSSAA